jgi:hypothetical protein
MVIRFQTAVTFATSVPTERPVQVPVLSRVVLTRETFALTVIIIYRLIALSVTFMSPTHIYIILLRQSNNFIFTWNSCCYRSFGRLVRSSQQRCQKWIKLDANLCRLTYVCTDHGLKKGITHAWLLRHYRNNHTTWKTSLHSSHCVLNVVAKSSKEMYGIFKNSNTFFTGQSPER